MKNLLRLEFRKLFQMKTLYIFAGVIVAFLALNIGTYKFTEFLLDSASLETTGMDLGIFFLGPFDAKKFLISALICTEAVIALAVVVSLINCSDYTSGAIKNIISKGYSRMHILLSKITVSIIVATIFTVICWIFGFLFGYAFWQDAGSGWEPILLYNLFTQLMLMIAYCSLFCLLASLIKKTAGTIVLSIVIPISSEVLFTIINLLVNEKNFNINNYTIQGNITNLSSASASASDITQGLIVAIVFFAIFTALNVLISRKREV